MMFTKRRVSFGVFFLLLVLFASQVFGQAGNDRTYIISIDENGKIEMSAIPTTSNLPLTIGTKIAAIESSSGAVRSVFYEPFPFVFSEAINPDTGEYFDFGMDTNSKAGIIIASASPSQNDFSLKVPGVGRSSQDVFVDLGSFQNRCGDGICQRGYENYFSCSIDCSSGSYDDYCDAISDGICDRDCFSQVGTVVDVDCQVPNLGACDQNSTYCWSDAIFGCVLDATSNPVWIWEENCELSCSQNGNRASCGEIEVLKVNPICKTDNDCIVNGEQWYCGCSGSCLKEQVGGECCFQ